MLSRSVLKSSFLKKVLKTCVVISAQNASTVSENYIVRSPLPDIRIPDVFLEEFVWKRLNEWPDKTATVCAETGRSYSYAELQKRSKSVAYFVRNVLKLEPKETVAIILPNVPEYPMIMLGIIQAGLQATTVNPVYTSDEITKQLKDAETKLIFTLTDYWPKVKQALENLNWNTPTVMIDHQNSGNTPRGAIKFNEIVQGNGDIGFETSRRTDDVIILPYSSGTTGLPKGVELTNRSIVSNLHQMEVPGYKLYNDTVGNDQEVSPLVLPMFHIYGMVVVLLNMLSHGVKLVTVPKFSSQIFLKVLKEHRPTIAYLVPPIVLMLLNNPEFKPEYITQIRTILSGAAPLGGEDIERLRRKCEGKTDFLQVYGLTETSPLTHSQSPLLEKGVKTGGSGFALPNTECRMIAADKESDENLGPNKTGEILIRGPQVMRGYRRNPEATRKAVDPEGWFRTGDIGHFDEDGHFYVTDRLKELIKVKGFQVAPAELEAILRDHPEIEDAAVVGIPHKEFGEVPKAFVVVAKDSTVKSGKIEEYVAAKVANFKRLLGGVVFVDNIPKNASGKLLRRQLKEL